MGIYVYTLRRKTRKVSGVDVRYYSYAYKPSYTFTTSYNLKQRIQRHEKAAKAAFEDYDGGPVMIADADDKDLNGRPVYRKARTPIWHDCDDFPGELIGFIKQDGHKLTLVSEYRWRAQQPNDRTFVEYIKDGKLASRVEMD